MKRLSAILVFLALTMGAARPQTVTSTVTANSNGTATITTIYTPAAVPVVTEAPPVIGIFTASPSSIAAGQSAALDWAVSGTVNSLTLSGVTGTPVAGIIVSPTVTTTYVLTATNEAGSVSASVTVTVNPAPVPPAGTALTACGDLTAAGTYYLANDVSSTEGCFGIDANNITLNLNGHTITYDTGGTANSPAIEAHDSWSATNPVINGPAGTAHGGFEVYGGTIAQAVSASTFSPIFEFGQSSSITPAPYIHDITATFQNTGAQFYKSAYLPPGAKIENNVIYDNVTNINQPGQGDLSARSAFQGQAIYIGQNNDNPGIGDTISGNKIVGSPQGGVRTVNQHSTISGNDIAMDATYSNDFCADVPADYTTVSGNNCHPKSGRGFHVGGLDIVVSGNTIAVTELKQNAEYGTTSSTGVVTPGCEGGGAYGVQIEDDGALGIASNLQVTGNTVSAVAGDCEASGLRISGVPPTETATVSGNTFTTTNTGGAGQDFGISVDGVDAAGITIAGNTFNSQYAYADGEWDSYKDVTVGKSTWLGTPKYTFVAEDGSCALNESGVSVCPSAFTFVDSLPNTVLCGTYSKATITIGGKETTCNASE